MQALSLRGMCVWRISNKNGYAKIKYGKRFFVTQWRTFEGFEREFDEFGDNSSQNVKGTLMGQWENINNFSKTIFLLHQPGWTQVSKACLTCRYEGQMLQTLFFQIPFNQDSLSQCLLTLRAFHGNSKNTLVYLHPGGTGKSFTSSCEFHFGKEVI